MGVWSSRSGPLSPYIDNIIPAPDAANIDAYALIYFDILDTESNVTLDSVKIYIKDSLAYDGYYNTFYSPYNGINSTITPIVDGYHVVIDSVEEFISIVSIYTFIQDKLLRESHYRWAFTIKNIVNTVYFCDGYGLKAIDINDIVGESQSVVRQVFSENTLPYIKNNIRYLHGKRIDDISYLTLSMVPDIGGAAWGGYNWGGGNWGLTNAPGVVIIANDVDPNYYLSGYNVSQAQLTTTGTMYAIDLTNNRISVFYGANTRDGYERLPDYTYDAYSTPAIVPGVISCLHIVSNVSTQYTNGTRMYVGTSLGMSRVETYDSHVDGYSDGYDSYGVSFNYGIVGSGLTYESIGGTVPEVVAISSNEVENVAIVATNDGYDNGGLTYITLVGNRKVVFIDEETELIPSNDIRNIFNE
jgi:hypothetical protein